MGARVVSYTRVSSADQTESGLGLDAQAAAIDAAAARLGLPVAARFTDAGLSGGLPLEQRPGLVAALDALCKGDVLIVSKRDRLGRDVLNVAMLERLAERKGARIVSAAGEGTDANDPTSRLMRQIVDAFSEYERALIRARTKAALAVKRSQGKRAGTIPYGYGLAADGSTLVVHSPERDTLATIRALADAGHSTRSIAAELNARGLTTRSGGRWAHSYVARFLTQTAA